MKLKRLALFFALSISSPAFADGNWTTKTSEGWAGIGYERESSKDGYDSFSAAIDDLAKKGAISHLSSINLTTLLAVDRNLDKEVKEMLKRDWPNELKAARQCAGNMHNPALVPIYRPFVESLLKTTLITEIETALNQHRLKLKPISFEKFSFVDRDGFRPFWGLAYLRVEPADAADASDGQ